MPCDAPEIAAFWRAVNEAESNHWTLYTQTYGGRIGITHGLVKDECEMKRKQAMSVPATDEENAAAKMFQSGMPDCHNGCRTEGPAVSPYMPAMPLQSYVVSASDIRSATCLDKPLDPAK